jgi:hypothetical protein
MAIAPNHFLIGQTVTVRESSHGLQIAPSAQDEAGLTVIEVGADHLVLEDAADGSKRSIPLYLIQKPAPVSDSFMDNQSDHQS